MRKFDLLVIGGGSGGVACSRRAASYGKKVALFEYKRLGGTCVNVGCVPKKVMYNSAEIHNAIKIAPEYGFDVKIPTLNYSVLKRKRDAYVERLNGIYSRLLNNSNVEVISQKATFKENKVVVAGGLEYTAPVIVIAAGGEPNTLNIPGKEYAINSDDFFNKMDKVPKKIAIIGGGYIGNEIACVLNSLGSQVTVIYRGDKILRGFDEMLRNSLIESMTANGIKIKLNTNLSKITKNDHFLDIETTKGDIFKRFDQVLFAVGRHSVADQLGLSNTALKLNNKNEFETDEWEETNVKGVYALGDINGKIQLTPVAISAGRALADRLFDGQKNRKTDYENVPSVVFTHPPIGTVGLTENEAVKRFGRNKIKTYKSTFVNMLYALSEIKPKTNYKVVCLLPEEKVLGVHLFGHGSDEILQGFAVAIKMGATKKQLDSCVAIHPTAAEELVTMR